MSAPQSSRLVPSGVFSRSPGRALLLAACVLGIATTAGCGSSGDDSRNEALESLRLTTEAASLQSEMGKLVGSLGGDPSPAQQAAARRHLTSLDREAAHLIAVAGAESTYEVELRPLNGARTVGVATLVESEGKVGMQGTLRGLAAGGDHAVAIHALGPGQGRSVCPPRNAAAGSDRVLSSSEAEDFYGRPAVRLGSVPAGSQHSVSFTRPAGGSPPLDVRVLVISGGLSKGAYRADLPIACGVPAVAEGRADASSSTELVAAVNQTRAAGVEIAAVVRDPASPTAAAARLDSAADHLGVANHIVVRELREAGEVSAGDRQAAARAKAALGGSRVVVRGGFAKLKKEVARERREERRRLAQRHAAQEAAREASEEANPGPVPEPTNPEPEYAPEPAPAPAPAPTPSAPEGPTIVSP